MNISIKLLTLLVLIGFSLNYAIASEVIGDETIQYEALAAHNRVRVLHHAPKLIWDNELANYAERYANKCQFKHSSSPYGENLAMGYPTVTVAVNAWYAEHEKYSYFFPRFSYKTGHFTQVVWKSTTKLGCAFVWCDGRNGLYGHFLVCEYSPHGNITNSSYFRKNVLPQ